MLSPRKIHVGSVNGNRHLSIVVETLEHGLEELSVVVHSSITTFLRNRIGSQFRFSRRKFSPARKITFMRETAYDEYTATIDSKVLWLCNTECEDILGISYGAKKFSLWVGR